MDIKNEKLGAVDMTGFMKQSVSNLLYRKHKKENWENSFTMNA